LNDDEQKRFNELVDEIDKEKEILSEINDYEVLME